MKLFLFLLAIAAALPLRAQTNPPAPSTNGMVHSILIEADPGQTNTVVAPTNALPRPSTEIFSDTGDFDLKSRVAVYSGHVRVVDAQMTLLCDVLTVTVPEGSSRVNQIIAETNVIINAMDKDGKPIHATGDRAVYIYKVENSVTNETIVLTGNPRVVRDTDSLSGDTIMWDRQKNQFRATGKQHTTFVPDTPSTNKSPSSLSHTNRP